MKPSQILLNNAEDIFSSSSQQSSCFLKSWYLRCKMPALHSAHTHTHTHTQKDTFQALFPSHWPESCLCFAVCCFPLPPADRQLAALLWQRWELPDTHVAAWLVSGRFSTLTLGVWRAANVLEGWLTEKEMIMSTSSLAWAELGLTVSCVGCLGPDGRLCHNCNTVTFFFFGLIYGPHDQFEHCGQGNIGTWFWTLSLKAHSILRPWIT